MTDLFPTLLAIAVTGVVLVLILGLIGLVRPDGLGRHANKLMRARVILQAVAVVLFILALIARG